MVAEKGPGEQGIALAALCTWGSSVNCRVRWGVGNTSLVVITDPSFLAPVPLGESSLLEAVVRFIDFYFFSVDNGVRPRSPSGSGVMERPVMRALECSSLSVSGLPLCFGGCL